MKILYSIQGTGNGHLSRAISIYPYLKEFGTIDFLISGSNYSLDTPFEIKYKLPGVSFQYNSKGGIDYLNTIRQIDLKSWCKEINQSPVEEYDVVFNDFEPISARACLNKKVPCIALSHQASFLSPKTPIPPIAKDHLASAILRKFAPAHDKIGFHFQSYDSFIHTPVIKDDIRTCTVSEEDHITVYLPSFGLFYLRNLLSSIPNYKFEVFHSEIEEEIEYKNIKFKSISRAEFNKSLASSNGVIANAGFEIPSEAFYLGKPMLLIPITRQYEQACNAYAASKLGAQVIYKPNNQLKEQIIDKLLEFKPVKLDFPAHYHQFITEAFSKADQVRSKLKLKTY